MASERKSKGTMLSVMQGYVVVRFGTQAWRQILDHMKPADRAHVESAVAIGWYPTSAIMNAFVALEAVIGPSQPDLISDFGRSGAEQDLTVFHRMFLRMANPAYVAEKVGDYWGKFHTHGKWQSRRTDHGYVGTLSDFEGNVTYCAILVPYMTRLLELVGAKSVKVTHTECVHRADKACVFTAKWS